MSERTLIFLRSLDTIALAAKKSGFGSEYINGYGGKLETGESVEDAALRELMEEATVRAEKEDLQKIGVVHFYFPNSKHDQTVHWFFLEKWHGTPQETEEMFAPEWFALDDLPVDKMWPADSDLLAEMQKKFVEAKVYFSEKGVDRIEYL